MAYILLIRNIKLLLLSGKSMFSIKKISLWNRRHDLMGKKRMQQSYGSWRYDRPIGSTEIGNWKEYKASARNLMKAEGEKPDRRKGVQT